MENQYPQGKLNDTDQGALVMKIYEEKGEIVIDFGKDLSWIGFSKEKARALGELLIAKSKKL